ncbi:STAS domain-containing protein [Bacillus sp. SG-1]|uniref:STAS domain-containing protein n=1 Tax=Bacillus sp. SG-1 TaxID=161544 RepID=UPI00030BE111|nr:STAS domain-containing protein [Bacillus sp. SG-1]
MKEQNNQLLFQYIIENAPNMTNDWLDSREEASGYSIYSKSASPEVESKLRKHNDELIESIAYIFVSKEKFEDRMIKWTEKIAEERVESGTTLYEVIQKFSIFRRIYWDVIEKFIDKNNIDVQQVVEWSKELNTGIDSIIEKFTEHYNLKTRESFSKQENLIKSITSPVIPVTENVAIFPLLGNLNITIADGLADAVLQQCVKYQISKLFIDISGVGTIDTMIANQLFQMISSLKLIGVEAFLSGIRPELAMTAVHLGINFKEYPSYSSLKQALKENGFQVEMC